MTPKRIVAEVTRSWTGKDDDETRDLVSERFEKVIAANVDRGYSLEDWQFQAVSLPDGIGSTLTETIIATFVEDEQAES